MSKTYLSIQTLCLELTRRCNMHCAHCLRGDAQQSDIKTEVIDAALKNVSSIDSLVFTGGEPTLNVPAIRYTLDKCKELDVRVFGFYLVTNGKEVTREFLEVMLDWYVYVVQCGGETEFSGLALSRDMYHEKIPFENEVLLRGLSFFREDKFQKGSRWLLSEGRGAALNEALNSVSPECARISCTEDEDEKIVSIEDSPIYVTVAGDVILGCDWSYGNQAQHQLGTVFDQTGWLDSIQEESEAA